MSPERYHRFTVRMFDLSFWGVLAVATLIWLASLADYFLKLGWGYDVQDIWIAPTIIAGALLVRTVGHAIFRRAGALD